RLAVVQGGVRVDDLIQVVRRAGYDASRHRDTTNAQAGATTQAESAAEAERHAVVMAVLLSLPLIVPMLLEPFGIHWMLPGWLQWLLATPVQFWLGARFYKAAWHAVKARTGNMDLLVAIGT